MDGACARHCATSLGIAASFLAQVIGDPVPILVFKIDTGMVAFIGGLFLTLVCVSYLSGQWIAHREANRKMTEKPSWSKWLIQARASHPTIFEELYRGANARGTDGSGLGLALVNRIIVLHGGQLEVRSRQENPPGTVFTLRVPEGR